jgi:hypothetical protein
MITLPPFPPQRSVLVSFWLVLNLAGGLLIGTIASLFLSPGWFVSGAAFAVAMAVPGLLRPQIASFPYRAWNKLARQFARVARFCVTGICYYGIFVTVGQTGSAVRLIRPTPHGSLWVSRRGSALPRYPHPDGIAQELPQRSWIRSYCAWAVKSGNVWAVSVLPFVIVLAFFEAEQPRNALPADIYTLF